jgi:hypothetical protein
LVVVGWTEDEEGVIAGVEMAVGVTKLNVDADFVSDALLTVLLLDATTPVVAVATDTEVVVIVTPDTTTAVEVATLEVSGAPPGAIAMASNVGEERVAGSMQSPFMSPIRPGRQQK